MNITQPNGSINGHSPVVVIPIAQVQPEPEPGAIDAKAALGEMATTDSAHSPDVILKCFVRALYSRDLSWKQARQLIAEAIDALNSNPRFRIPTDEPGGDDPLNYDEWIERALRAYKVWQANGSAKEPLSFLPTEPEQSATQLGNEEPKAEEANTDDASADTKTGKPIPKPIKGAYAALYKAVSAAELWRSPDGNEYITLPYDGKSESYLLKAGGTVGKQLRYLTMTNGYKGHINDTTFTIFISELQAKAAHGGVIYKPSVRVAACDGNIYIDLANNEGEVIEARKDGWVVTTVTPSPVRFIRTPGMKATPNPVRSQENLLQLLMRHFNVTKQTSGKTNIRDAILLAGVMISFLVDRGPYPILVVNGEQGSAKTTFIESVKYIIDPTTPLRRKLPKASEDIMIHPF